MAKKILLSGIVLLVVVAATLAYLATTTRQHSPRADVQFTAPDISVAVSYCQPFKKRRTIFGSRRDGALVPNGRYWRTGANEATEITFANDVLFGDSLVKAGRYRLYTIPDEKEWKVVLNSELGAWGFFEPNYALDVVAIQIPPAPTDREWEQFTITGIPKNNGIILSLKWDMTKVDIPIRNPS